MSVSLAFSSAGALISTLVSVALVIYFAIAIPGAIGGQTYILAFLCVLVVLFASAVLLNIVASLFISARYFNLSNHQTVGHHNKERSVVLGSVICSDIVAVTVNVVYLVLIYARGDIHDISKYTCRQSDECADNYGPKVSFLIGWVFLIAFVIAQAIFIGFAFSIYGKIMARYESQAKDEKIFASLNSTSRPQHQFDWHLHNNTGAALGSNATVGSHYGISSQGHSYPQNPQSVNERSTGSSSHALSEAKTPSLQQDTSSTGISSKYRTYPSETHPVALSMPHKWGDITRQPYVNHPLSPPIETENPISIDPAVDVQILAVPDYSVDPGSHHKSVIPEMDTSELRLPKLTAKEPSKHGSVAGVRTLGQRSSTFGSIPGLSVLSSSKRESNGRKPLTEKPPNDAKAPRQDQPVRMDLPTAHSFHIDLPSDAPRFRPNSVMRSSISSMPNRPAKRRLGSFFAAIPSGSNAISTRNTVAYRPRRIQNYRKRINGAFRKSPGLHKKMSVDSFASHDFDMTNLPTKEASGSALAQNVLAPTSRLAEKLFKSQFSTSVPSLHHRSSSSRLFSGMRSLSRQSVGHTPQGSPKRPVGSPKKTPRRMESKDSWSNWNFESSATLPATLQMCHDQHTHSQTPWTFQGRASSETIPNDLHSHSHSQTGASFDCHDPDSWECFSSTNCIGESNQNASDTFSDDHYWNIPESAESEPDRTAPSSPSSQVSAMSTFRRALWDLEHGNVNEHTLEDIYSQMPQSYMELSINAHLEQSSIC